MVIKLDNVCSDFISFDAAMQEVPRRLPEC